MGETGIGKLRLSELSKDGRLSDKQGKRWMGVDWKEGKADGTGFDKRGKLTCMWRKATR